MSSSSRRCELHPPVSARAPKAHSVVPPPSGLSRRSLIAAAGAAGLGACSKERNLPPEKPRVSVVRAEHYDQSLYDKIYRLVLEHNLNVNGKRVVLKPNLVEFDSNTCINTHPLVVHATFEAFKRLGAAEVRIAEGPGHRRTTLDLAHAARYFSTVPNFENSFTDLNLDNVSLVRLKNPHSKLEELYLPNTVLQADLIVSLPKMKTHHWVGATLSMKNFFGVVPGGVYGWPKNVLHWAGINETIADLHSVFGQKTFAIVDGVIGMEGNGPIQGSPKPAGILAAGTDCRVVDSVCCHLMGIDYRKIRYLTLSGAQKYVDETDLNRHSMLSNINNFKLIPEMADLRTL